jgi:ABC-type multidrug transport system ATPase subunit
MPVRPRRAAMHTCSFRVGFVPRDIGQRTPRIGFVPQQDVLPVMLTVGEALLFTARLRLPEYVTDAEKRQRVEDIIE